MLFAFETLAKKEDSEIWLFFLRFSPRSPDEEAVRLYQVPVGVVYDLCPLRGDEEVCPGDLRQPRLEVPHHPVPHESGLWRPQHHVQAEGAGDDVGDLELEAAVVGRVLEVRLGVGGNVEGGRTELGAAEIVLRAGNQRGGWGGGGRWGPLERAIIANLGGNFFKVSAENVWPLVDVHHRAGISWILIFFLHPQE